MSMEFEWISNQKQWDSAIAALLLLDLPMALLDDGGNVRHTIIKDEDVGIAVLSEKSSHDGRGDTAWRQSGKTYFVMGGASGVAQFQDSEFSDLALLSLALHAASANCTDDDGKPYTLDGVTTAHLDDLDLSCSIDGCSWVVSGIDPGKRPAMVLMSHGDVMSWVKWCSVEGMWRWRIHEGIGGSSITYREAMDAVQDVLKPKHTAPKVEYNPGLSFLDGSWRARSEATPIEVVDVTPTTSYADRLAKCLGLIPRISPDALCEIEKHVDAIAEIEGAE